MTRVVDIIQGTHLSVKLMSGEAQECADVQNKGVHNDERKKKKRRTSDDSTGETVAGIKADTVTT